MKILYAIQGTGNGHMSRAQVFIPILKKYGELDILISSKDHDIRLSHPIKYRINGLGFTFGKSGGIDYWKSFWKFKLMRFFIDMIQFPIEDYDVIINDFEPLTAWKCKLKGKKIVSLSHHSSYQSALVPRTPNRDWFNEMVLKYHSPCKEYYSFHFKAYDENIFTPIIRSKIREGLASNINSILVYLPSFDSAILLEYFFKIPNYQFYVFCKHTEQSYQKKNVNIFTISEEVYIEKLLSCTGVICNAGFETPSEAIFLKKKLICIPMKGQYEQKCNAEALRLMGITIIDSITSDFDKVISSWIADSQIIHENYPNQSEEIIAKIIDEY